jgi:hypothetical protein
MQSLLITDAICETQEDVKALRTSLQGRTLDFLLQSIDFQNRCSSEARHAPLHYSEVSIQSS